ncbi:MAG TPA: hypothetical protein VML96_01885, partial [Egibacteraceae bacterium]|nr:hypothetical protein [Egibacteraceae bacterium]
MNRIVKLLGSAVVRTPWAVVGVALLITAVLGYFSGQQKQVDFTEGFSPDNPQLRALERSGELFGEAQSFMQVLVSSDGGDVISADGVAAAAAIEQAVRASGAADRLADRPDQPAVIADLAPVFQGAALSGTDPTQLDDAGVDALYLQAMSQMPAQQADLLAAMLPADADPDAARSDSGLMLVFLDLADLQEDDDFEGVIEAQRVVADTVAEADLPPGISAAAFSVDLLFEDDGAFEAEIARLFSLAALVIMIILA